MRLACPYHCFQNNVRMAPIRFCVNRVHEMKHPNNALFYPRLALLFFHHTEAYDIPITTYQMSESQKYWYRLYICFGWSSRVGRCANFSPTRRYLICHETACYSVFCIMHVGELTLPFGTLLLTSVQLSTVCTRDCAATAEEAYNIFFCYGLPPWQHSNGTCT